MPNHITNLVTVTGPADTVDAFVNAHVAKDKDGDPFFDFSTIVPKPACVDGTESSSAANAGFFALTGLTKTSFAAFGQSPMVNWPGFECGALTTPQDFLAHLEKTKPDYVEKGRALLRCLRETGHRDWYEWNIANWGTKLGAYSYKERERSGGRLVITFETAWSPPEPIFQKLAKMYPTLTIETESIDEGGGEYVGRAADGAFHLEHVDDCNARYLRVYGRARDTYEDEAEECSEAESP